LGSRELLSIFSHLVFMVDKDNTNRNFRGQQKNEAVLCFCRKHWIVLLPYFLNLVFVLAAVGILFYIRSYIGENIFYVISTVAIIGGTYFIHSFFIHFLNYYLRILIVTNFRVIELNQTLYFNKTGDSIDLREIQDIEVHQEGVLKTIFNYGEVVIALSSAGTSKTIRYIPNPQYHFSKINKTKREYISSKGVK